MISQFSGPPDRRSARVSRPRRRRIAGPAGLTEGPGGSPFGAGLPTPPPAVAVRRGSPDPAAGLTEGLPVGSDRARLGDL